ncbi:MAG: type VI secretion system contractile sheath small subunit [Myxococcota bacterium]|nr:type VI secretion system contractile sheath small subunit [Myxococcota bacterium]
MSIQDEIPKSRLTLKYKTEVDGQPEDVSLPLRMMIVGDFSGGTSNDRNIDLDERRIRNFDGRNTDAVMKDMGMSLNFTVDNKVDPEQAEEMDVSLKVDSMKSFNPESVAEQIPKLKGLLMLKELLEEMTSNVDNRKEFRKLLNELLQDQDALANLKDELKGFDSFVLPTEE